jgi:GH24 family phage-related lysozyme (muramidase)
VSGNQLIALTSLVHDIGADVFRESAIAEYLGDNLFELVAGQFDRFTRVDGKSVFALEQRRAAERALFITLASPDS